MVVNDKLEKGKEVVVVYFKLLLQHSPEVTKENYE
jgi:hypothetical protein